MSYYTGKGTKLAAFALNAKGRRRILDCNAFITHMRLSLRAKVFEKFAIPNQYKYYFLKLI